MIQRNWSQPVHAPDGFAGCVNFRENPDGWALAKFYETTGQFPGWTLYRREGEKLVGVAHFGRPDTSTAEAICLTDHMLGGTAGADTAEHICRLGIVQPGETLHAILLDGGSLVPMPEVREVVVMSTQHAIRGFLCVRGLTGPAIAEAKFRNLYRDRNKAVIEAAKRCAEASAALLSRRESMLESIEYTPAEEMAGLDRVLDEMHDEAEIA